MGIIFSAAIASAHQRSKNRYKSKKSKKEDKVELDKDGMKPYTQEWKNKHLKWVEDGLCGSCGAPSGEELGICDECRWS